MNKIVFGLIFGLIAFCSYANENWIVNYNDAGRPETISFNQDSWVKLNEEKGLEYWINVGDIQEHESFRHVMAMIRFTGEARVVPGVGRNIKRIYSEGVLDCKSSYLSPIVDFYTTDMNEVVGWHIHKKSNDIVNTREVGTIGNAIYGAACLGKTPAPVPNN